MKKEKKASRSNSSAQSYTGLLRDERGTVVPIVAMLLVVIFGFSALVLDLGWLFVVRGELQNAADAGVMAGVVELVLNSSSEAEDTAVVYGTQSGNFRLNIPSPGADAVEVTVLGPETLQVLIVRAEGTTAGPVPTIFARIWGKETAEVRAVAVATLNHRVIGTGPSCGLMPFGIHEDMLKNLDDSDGDGVYDSIDIYPHSWSPGNFGLLDLDGGSNSNAETAYWIENGYDGIFIIPESTGYINVEGDPGISGGSLNGAISSRVSSPEEPDRVLFPVFDQVTGNGANTIFHVVGFVGGIIEGFQLTGNIGNRELLIGVTDFSATCIILGDGDTELNPTVSAPVLIQ